jgi:Ni/Co efflux regulator RcnB
MKTMVSMLIAVSTLATTGVLAQTPASAAQIDREFRSPREAGKASRAAHVRAQRTDRRGALEARAQRTVVTPAAFDGSWSVAINTQSGACEPHYRFGVQIINGNVVYEGRPAGRVSPNGAVRVNVSSGGQQAAGQGRLSRTHGSGVWRGYGSAGTCAGTWQAGRGG